MPTPLTEDLKHQAIILYNQYNLADARSLYEQISRLDPADSETWLMLGLIDAESSRENEAISNLQTALKHDPMLTRAYQKLGEISANQGQLVKARGFFNKVITIDPDNLDGWVMLGMMDARTGAVTGAEYCFMQAASQADNPATTWMDIARKLNTQGSINLEADAYRHVLQLQPENKTALRNLSELQLASGQLSGAIRNCQSLLRLNPADARAYSIMGSAFQSLGEIMDARHCLEQAVTMEPDNNDFCYKYACVLHILGDLDQALLFFKKAMETGGGLPVAIGGLIRVYAQKGDDDSVRELLQPLIEAGRKDPLTLPTLAAIAPRHGLTKTGIKLLEDATSKRNLTDNVRSRLHHALGKLYEETEEFDAAFINHKTANELTAGKYNSEAYTRYCDRIIACFSKDFINTAPRASNNTHLPVFIVGMPRSGTSLVEQILASHRDVYGAGELQTIDQITRHLLDRMSSGIHYPEYCNKLTTEQLDVAANHYLHSIKEISPSALRITDKMPHNFLYLGLIELLLPDARIIHVSRNPLDTCLSCYFQEFSATYSYTTGLNDLAHHYSEYVRLMRHWNNTLNIPIMNLQYEELVTNHEPVVRDLVDFCELDWDDNCLNFHNTKRIVSTLSSEQVRRPLYKSSIGRWKNYKAHLDALEETLGIA